MDIRKCGSQSSAPGPAEYFTGTVRIDAPFAGDEPARIGGATVTFEPGARTAWHTHPLGQTLICDIRPWLRAAVWRSNRGNQTGRHRLDRTGRKTLARRYFHHRHDAHRHR